MMLGYMVNFDTWEKFIRLSDGSERMKTLVIEVVRIGLRTEDGLLDSLKLGYLMGAMGNYWAEHQGGDATEDFWTTIKLTRDLNNVPFVRSPQGPVS